MKAMITQIVNDAVHDQYISGIQENDLLIVKTNQEGNISFLQSNTIAMNQLGNRIDPGCAGAI